MKQIMKNITFLIELSNNSMSYWRILCTVYIYIWREVWSEELSNYNSSFKVHFEKFCVSFDEAEPAT